MWRDCISCWDTPSKFQAPSYNTVHEENSRRFCDKLKLVTLKRARQRAHREACYIYKACALNSIKFSFFKSKKKNNNFKWLRAGRIVRCISVGVCVLQTLNWCALMTVVCIRVWFWDRVFFVLHEAFHLGSWSHLTLHRGRKSSVGQKFKNVWKKKKGLFYVTPTTCTASTAGRVELGCERLGGVTRSPLPDLG